MNHYSDIKDQVYDARLWKIYYIAIDEIIWERC